MGTRKGNTIANENGIRFENYARRKLGVKIDPNATTDAPRLDVKSCQEWIEDQGGRRHGRFVFYGHQHRALIKSRGSYLCIVHRRGKKIGERRISAAALEKAFRLSKYSQKVIAWHNLIAA